MILPARIHVDRDERENSHDDPSTTPRPQHSSKSFRSAGRIAAWFWKVVRAAGGCAGPGQGSPTETSKKEVSNERTERWIAAAWFAVGVLTLSVTVSTDARAQAPAVDPAAVQKLKQMTDFLDALEQFSVNTQNTIEELHVSGHRADKDLAANVTVKRPNKLHAARAGGLMDQRFFSGSSAIMCSSAARVSIFPGLDRRRQTTIPAQVCRHRNGRPRTAEHHHGPERLEDQPGRGQCPVQLRAAQGDERDPLPATRTDRSVQR
jgi:hypothetical protein